VALQIHETTWAFTAAQVEPVPYAHTDFWSSSRRRFSLPDMKVALKCYQDKLAEGRPCHNKISAINYPEKYR
jgi:hypothetical protein